MDSGDYWFWTITLVVISLGGFYGAFRSLRRARIIEDTPTALIRSAPQGYVELAGTADYFEALPAVAPLTGRDCCWYRFKIERKGDKNWHTVERGTSDEPFVLRDDTGECIVDPEGAEISTQERNVWYGSSRHPSDRNPPPARRNRLFGFHLDIDRGSGFGFGTRYRYTEERIYRSESLYAIGWFKSMDDVDHNINRREMLRDQLKAWKQDPKVMARFDRNKDGQIDEQEWEAARRAAEYKVKRDYAKELEGTIIHTLSKPATRHHPFLLSTMPEFDLVKRYRFTAFFSIAAFFGCAGFAAWLIIGGPPA